MKNETFSTLYAAALLDLAHEKNEVERVREEVAFLKQILDQDASSRSFFESPKIERSEKLRVIESTLRGKVADSIANIFCVVIRKGRTLYLSQIFEDFSVLHDKRAGIVHASAVTAVPLSDESRAALVDALSAKLRKRIQLGNKVDPGILGGLVVRYDGMVADGSLRTAIRKVGVRMNAVKLGSQFILEN